MLCCDFCRRVCCADRRKTSCLSRQQRPARGSADDDPWACPVCSIEHKESKSAQVPNKMRWKDELQVSEVRASVASCFKSARDNTLFASMQACARQRPVA